MINYAAAKQFAALILLPLLLLVGTFLSTQRNANASTPVQWTFKGATLSPYWVDELANPNLPAALQQLVSTGANAVTFAPTWYQDNIYSANIYRTNNTASDASLINAIQIARNLGLKVIITPHVDSEDGIWRAHIHPCTVTTEEPCQSMHDLAPQWFANYQALIGHYADLAQANGVTQLTVGAELIDLSINTTYEPYWRKLIADVRRRFTGSLTYSANWGFGDANTEFTNIPFWDALDYIGISAYYEIADSPNDSVAQMNAKWTNIWMPAISRTHNQWGKPVMFTEIGYRNINDSCQHPWDSWSQTGINNQQQVSCYESTFETWANVPWFAGMMMWNWSSTPNVSSTDTSYYVQNKPAYDTIRSWYGGAAALTTASPTPLQATPTNTPTLTPGSTSIATPTATSTPMNTSTATSVPAAPSCPSPWSCIDIGSPGVPGSQSFSNGAWTVKGSGGDIWNNSDQFRFVAQSLTGDGSVSGRISSQSPTDSWAKAGVMIRGNSDPGAPFYAVFMTPGNGIAIQARTTTGSNAILLATMSGQPPLYLRVTRLGNVFTVYTSGDGVAWSSIPGSALSLTLPVTAQAGLAVTAHNNGVVSSAVFDQVKVLTSTGGVPPTSTNTPTSTPGILNTTTNTVVPVTSATPIPTVPTATPMPTIQTATPVPTAVPTQTSVTTTSCPMAWTCGDIGQPSVPGSQTISGNTWSVSGAGNDIWNTVDQFHFVWQTLSGSGAIMAPIRSQTATDPWAKAGLMVRADSSAGAAFYGVFVTPNNGIIIEARFAPGNGAQQLVSTSASVPVFLQISRNGNQFTAYTSSNGQAWTPIPGSSVSLTLPYQALAGVAVTSHNSGTLSTSTTDSVAISNF